MCESSIVWWQLVHVFIGKNVFQKTSKVNYHLSAKIVKAEYNAKQNRSFVFIVEAHPIFDDSQSSESRVQCKTKTMFCFHCRVTEWATLKMKPRISISTQRHRDTEFLFFSVSLYLCVVFLYDRRILSSMRSTKVAARCFRRERVIVVLHGFGGCLSFG